MSTWNYVNEGCKSRYSYKLERYNQVSVYYSGTYLGSVSNEAGVIRSSGELSRVSYNLRTKYIRDCLNKLKNVGYGKVKLYEPGY